MPIHQESFIQQIYHLSLDFPPTFLPHALTLDYHEIVGAHLRTSPPIFVLRAYESYYSFHRILTWVLQILVASRPHRDAVG